MELSSAQINKFIDKLKCPVSNMIDSCTDSAPTLNVATPLFTLLHKP